MKKLTTRGFVEKARKIKPDHDFSKVEYVNSYTKVKITCEKGHEFKIRPRDLLSGYGCSKCSVNYRYTTKEWIVEAKKIKLFYDYSEVEYVGAHTKVKITCEKGHEFKIRPSDLLSGKGCSVCALKRRTLTTEEFLEKAKKVKPFYDYSEVAYVKSYTKVKITCEKGHEFKITPNSLLSGTGCSKCASSKGEEKIRYFLNKSGIIFSEQKRFDDCKDTRLLPFDFYISSLNLCIEYDGEQHFKPTYFGSRKDKTKEEVNILAQDNLESVQRRDLLKTQYCKESNIKLLRITYADFEEIESVLTLYLS